MNYFINLLIMIGIYLPLAYSLNLTLGFGGLVCFCSAIFYGLGAYVYSILLQSQVNQLLAIGLTIFISGGFTLLVGLVALRFRGDMFIFITLSFQMIFFVLLNNLVDLTNGPYGIAGISRPELLGFIVKEPYQYLILLGLVDLVLFLLLFFLYQSPFGRTLKAMRENEPACQSLGIDSGLIYVEAFVVAAVAAAIPGIFYASYVTYIDPTSFTLKESIFQMSILLLGGAGNRKGPMAGVLIMLTLPEVLRFIGMPDTIAPNVREIIYGLMLVLLMYYRPSGIAGEYRLAQ